MSKRITVSSATPNDQGGVIPNDVIDFTRFNKNPVCLNEHRWSEDPIGIWCDLKVENGKTTGLPIFHGLTEASKTKKALYDGGWVRAASIGGIATWEENASGQLKYDKDGNRICKHFELYEISIVTLPSNEDAVQEDAVELHAKIYERSEIEAITNSITTLSSKFNLNMAKENEAAPANAGNPAKPNDEQANENKNNSSEHITLKTSDLPGFLGKLIESVKTAFKAEEAAATPPAPKDLPESTQQKDKNIVDGQPGPTGLSAAEKAKEKSDKAKEAAEKATEKVKSAKEKSEKEGASEEDMAAYEKAKEDAEEAMKAAESAEKAHEKAVKKDAGEEEDDEEEGESASKNASKKQTTNSAMKPEMKTAAKLREELKLASAPKHRVSVNGYTGKNFSQLSASQDENDKRLLNRVLSKDAEGKEIGEYAAVLNSIIADGKFKALVDKTKIMMNVNEGALGAMINNPSARAGIGLHHLSAQLNSGSIEMLGRDNVMRNITSLSSTDTALASPALNTIEWLSMAIFKLFPSTSWKNEIPLFPAEMTGKNTGIIWANISADPAIYKGNQPSNPANYQYNDAAVSLAITPYWLQPMLWNPLTMHQLRYDQMGTGWAQAFAKWNSIIDDNLIYTLASTVPANAIVTTTGLSGYQTTPQTFYVNGSSNPNKFYYNPAFVGNLISPVLNDITVIEQIYSAQNFELENEKSTLVCDPTMMALLKKDPETKSLLTRWVNQDGGDFTKYSDTILPRRSRVAIYDPATGQVKDPNGIIPSTAISAGLGFIPSQVGIGIGMLDVFMIQDPTNYGFKMSADIRMGIAPLRADFSGTSLLTYGAPAIVLSNV